jgi:tetratricopeptide (TPR) repeat protein
MSSDTNASFQDDENQINSLFEEGINLYTQQKTQEALEKYREILQLCKKANRRNEQGRTLNVIGLAYYQLGQYAEALDAYEQALEIFQKIGNLDREGMVLNNFGLIYKSQGQYTDALGYYYQALSIFQTTNNRLEQGHVLDNIGFVYYSLGQYLDALDYYHKALLVCRESGDLMDVVLKNIVASARAYLGQEPAIDSGSDQRTLLFRTSMVEVSEARDIRTEPEPEPAIKVKPLKVKPPIEEKELPTDNHGSY